MKVKRQRVYKNDKRKSKPKLKQLKSDNKDFSDFDVTSSDTSENEVSEVAENIVDERLMDEKLKMAKKYIEELKNEQNVENEENVDPVALRLEQEILEKAGINQKFLIEKYIEIKDNLEAYTLKMKATITAIEIGMEFIYVGCKDGCIYKYHKENGSKVGVIPGNNKSRLKQNQNLASTGLHGSILALALSHDEKYLAASCQTKMIYVYDPETLKLIETFKGHRDWVSGLVFRNGTHQLHSTSFDKTVKIWNLDDLAYIDTLYGHEDKVLSIDTLHKEHALTAGGLDYTIRLFKIAFETQSIYQAEVGYLQEYALMMSEEKFISISSNCAIHVWKSNKRKPLYTVDKAHLVNPDESKLNETSSCNYSGLALTALGLVPYSDIVVVGWSNGLVQFWKYGDDDTKPIQLKFVKHLEGVISSIKFSKCGKYLFIAVSRDSRLGRWYTSKNKNKIILYKIQ